MVVCEEDEGCHAYVNLSESMGYVKEVGFQLISKHTDSATMAVCGPWGELKY
jgi:hypothetical protein